MSDVKLSTLQQEWITLQTQFDSYEKHSLLIKLFNIALSGILLFALNAGCWVLIVCAVLWLQDGIWKTFQARMGQRLEVVEAAIKNQLEENTTTELGMQFNSKWSQSRPSAVGLVLEYIKQSLKPTVAYPHVILMAALFAYLYIF